MSTETRRITFTNEELIQAVSKHRRDEKQPLAESRIRGVKVEDDQELRISILLADHIGDAMQAIEFRATEVAAALIKYCRLKRIPLPRRASKALGVDRGLVSLVLQLEDL